MRGNGRYGYYRGYNRGFRRRNNGNWMAPFVMLIIMLLIAVIFYNSFMR